MRELSFLQLLDSQGRTLSSNIKQLTAGPRDRGSKTRDSSTTTTRTDPRATAGDVNQAPCPASSSSTPSILVGRLEALTPRSFRSLGVADATSYGLSKRARGKIGRFVALHARRQGNRLVLGRWRWYWAGSDGRHDPRMVHHQRTPILL